MLAADVEELTFGSVFSGNCHSNVFRAKTLLGLVGSDFCNGSIRS